MSTGFETMKSACTNFWHPAVDPTDKFDPTFLGVQRKAKVVPMLTPQHQERGKRIQVENQAHDPKVLAQIPAQYRELQASSDVVNNRFGNGFSRRGESTIQQDRLRVMKTADERVRKEAASDARRIRGASRNFSQFDAITGQPTSITKHFPTATPGTSEGIDKFHKGMRWPERVHSSVLGGTNPAILQARLPRTTSLSATTQPSLSRRQQQLLHEGLTVTKRDWSVSQQLACNDGYVVK
ncbi:Hypothetical protein, putative [Bodo saltans]|uniref:Uncharacterized protein n=1 Tax=Bodo saltans TaxID=75058 RepID=A0A0S4JQX3_BODSA|nr:Hypothetical protein, putative [Bodo saltans]|eukprot:CUG92600.1 Hypothetical protein, putative [Bodo saltans]